MHFGVIVIPYDFKSITSINGKDKHAKCNKFIDTSAHN